MTEKPFEAGPTDPFRVPPGGRRPLLRPQTAVSPIGRCIYCGKQDPFPLARFTDEHPLPYGFGGNLVLPESSCLTCQKVINREIEQPILAGDWGQVRERGRMPTRGKSGRTHVIARTKSGRTLKIPIDHYPAIAPFWKFGTAKLVSRSLAEPKRELVILGDSDGSQDRFCKQMYPDWDETYSLKVRYDAYARFLAKVAYSWIVANGGTGWFRESITDVILGRNKDIFSYVGGSLDRWGSDIESERPHFMIQPNGDGTGLVVFQSVLLAGCSYSAYHVVLGEADVEIDVASQLVTVGDNSPPERGVLKFTQNARVDQNPTAIQTPP